MSDTPPPAAARLTTLDGLRGAAALVVFVHHALLAVPILAKPYFHRGSAQTGSLPWWITYTPLHVFWNGTAAVYVFFVLSGLVLTLPAVGTGIRWREYYPRRLARLYVPVWAAAVLAYLWILVVPRHSSKHQSAWLNFHHRPRALDRLLEDLFLFGKPGHYNSPLWSLKYEVLFSLLLPVFVAFALTLRRLVIVKVVALVAIGMLGARVSSPEATYLPLFGIGALMAAHRDALVWPARRLRAGGNRFWWSVGLTALALLTTNATWQVRALLPGHLPDPDVMPFAYAVEMCGAALVVYLAWSWTPWARLLDGRACRWLGARSFSLYLVHEPIVVSVALLLGPRRAMATLFLAAPLVAAATELFYRLVEWPSIGSARTIGRWAGRRVTTRPAEPGAVAEGGPGRTEAALTGAGTPVRGLPGTALPGRSAHSENRSGPNDLGMDRFS